MTCPLLELCSIPGKAHQYPNEPPWNHLALGNKGTIAKIINTEVLQLPGFSLGPPLPRVGQITGVGGFCVHVLHFKGQCEKLPRNNTKVIFTYNPLHHPQHTYNHTHMHNPIHATTHIHKSIHADQKLWAFTRKMTRTNRLSLCLVGRLQGTSRRNLMQHVATVMWTLRPSHLPKVGVRQRYPLQSRTASTRQGSLKKVTYYSGSSAHCLSVGTCVSRRYRPPEITLALGTPAGLTRQMIIDTVKETRGR